MRGRRERLPFPSSEKMENERGAMGTTAKYQQVTEWILKRIASGELKEGDRLESENEISAAFSISRQTVRHALGILGQQGVLVSVQGSGTYVKSHHPAAAPLSRTVTIISTYVDGYIFPRILQAMVRTLEQAGYSSRVMFTNNHLETERQILERLLEEGSRDPLIVEPVMSGLPNPNLSCYRRLKTAGIPVLFFHSYYPELDIPHVSMDDEQVGRLAASHLISKGHTSIGGIFKADDGQGKRRYAGFISAMRENGIEVKEDRILWIDTQEMREKLRENSRILNRLKDCTACVCYNDELAYYLTKACQEKGISIPEQLSIVSVDNSDLARLNPVPLTSVAHPMEILGKKAAENMLRLIENPGCDATCEFNPELEERSSVRDQKTEI